MSTEMALFEDCEIRRAYDEVATSPRRRARSWKVRPGEKWSGSNYLPSEKNQQPDKIGAGKPKKKR